MKSYLIFLLILTKVSLYSQSKGVSPLSTANSQQSGVNKNTYAVVVGISDYQDPGIPDLRFADKDAEAFANYLKSKAGGNLDQDHIKLLLNKKATMAQFAIALDWLWEVVKENDQAIIYFSGHGDVEKKSLTQPGFLLCWDAPSQVYMSGGAFALPMLQEVISTLSVQNKAKVLVITDACRSGKLSGSSINGNQLTNANLAKQYANEIKILSCQPNEYSIEGEQWGGGRGAFSYHLLDALYGMADNNSDLTVNVLEIGRYLEDNVTKEVAPHSQVPMIIGVKSEKISLVDPIFLTSLRKAKEGQLIAFTSTDSRGIEDEVLQKVDTFIKVIYHKFYKALETKQFFKPFQDNADELFIQLMGFAELETLRSSMRRNYAAALQDDAQQVMNRWLKTDLSEMLSQKTSIEKYKYYPQYLERAAELLGANHYMNKILTARAYFFSGFLIALSSQNPDTVLGNKSIEQFNKALKLQPEFPLAYWQMSSVYAFNLLKLDSAEIYAQKAIQMIPSWTLPYTNIAFLLSEKYRQYDRAKVYLEQASKIDSNSANVWNAWGLNHNNAGEFIEAEKKFMKALGLNPKYTIAYNNLGITFSYSNKFIEAEEQFLNAIKLDSTFDFIYINLGNIYRITERYELAEKLYKKVIQMDSTESTAYYNLGNVFKSTRKFDLAEMQYKKAIELDPTFTDALNNLALIYLATERYDDAEYQYEKVLEINPSEIFANYNLGVVYVNAKKYNEAEDQFKKAIKLDTLFLNAFINLADIYIKTKRHSEAEQAYLKAIKIDSKDIDSNYGLACIYAHKNNMERAYYYLEQSILNGYKDYDWMIMDEDLSSLREQTESWKILIKKHFPDKMK